MNTPLNPDALEDAADVIWMRANGEHGVCRADRERGSYRIAVDAAEEAISAYLAVAQPVVNSVEELDALPGGTVIMATGGRWDTEHPELFLKCGYAHAPWMALDPSDRDDGENLESSGAVLKWRCDDEARVLYRPTKEATNGR